MNIRNVYLFLIVVLSLGLFFEWSSEKKNQSIESHLLDAKSSVFDVGDDYVVVENEELYVVVEVQTGKIVETRIKKHLVENVDGSLGYRVFGRSNERNCESPTFEVTTKNITSKKTISINGVISIENDDLLFDINFIS